MLKSLFGLDASQEARDFEFYFRGAWPLTVGLVVAALLFVLWQYRSESRLSIRRRLLLGLCQGGALLTIIVVILEPMSELRLIKPFRRTMLVLLDTSSSMAIEDQRKTAAEVGEAASILGKIPLNETLTADRVDSAQTEPGSARRIDLARAALQHADIKLLEKLEKNYDVRFFSFSDQVEPEGGGSDNATDWLSKREAKGECSKIGSAIEETIARYAGQPIAGLVVLSDFAWVEGKDPASVAAAIGARDIPIYTIPIGLPAPPDVHVRRVIAPEVVFKGDRVPLRVEIESYGYAGRSMELSLSVDGQRSTSVQVDLDDGLQFAELLFVPERDSGTIALEVSTDAFVGETTDQNNSVKHEVRVLDEKIKVLYVEGLPRWEYRYLRWVLLRDPRLDVRFLMTKGDPTLAATSPRHLARFPDEVEDALEFDLIILGDVPASYFNPKQLELMEKLVKTSGGSLLMIAGPLGSPGSYAGTPIERILPVKLGSGRWEGVSSRAHPVVTAAGRESSIVSLSTSDESTDRVWSHVRPMYALPNLGGAKPGATVLMSLPKDAEEIRDYPLVAWHRYGNGKSLFVATEDLWRMRLEVGDRYHARFWGQTIQFLTLSRLLGQNKQISLETDRGSYSAGEQIRVFANVLTESFEPVLQESYSVVLEKLASDSTSPDANSAELQLQPVPNSPGLYSGVRLATDDGRYAIRSRAQDAEVSNRVEFAVATIPLESRETAMLPQVAKQIAELSGGKTLSLAELASFPESLGEEPELSTSVKLEMSLWDIPLWFILLVLFSGSEWYLRRRDNLV